MRQIVIDTETTGLDPGQNHRIIEIGCVELIDRKYTGNNFHRYLNPERKIEESALAVHGITNEFLTDKPIFSEVITELLGFITGAELIAHNAEFDIGFINHEIRLLNNDLKSLDNYVTVFDTLSFARKLFPGQHNNLNALCKRYKIDLSSRSLHGALLDAKLLAEVYLLMTCGQSSLFSENELISFEASSKKNNKKIKKNKLALPIIYANDLELKMHEKLLAEIKKQTGNCIWEET